LSSSHYYFVNLFVLFCVVTNGSLSQCAHIEVAYTWGGTEVIGEAHVAIGDTAVSSPAAEQCGGEGRHFFHQPHADKTDRGFSFLPCDT